MTRTPLVPFALDDGARLSVHLKLENLQPIGSFKLRGAANAMADASADEIAQGVYTASAGNMAQGVAWCARERGVPCTVVVPEHAPRTKIDAIERLGGVVIRVPFERWWQTMLERHYPGVAGLFVHPFADTQVMAGNGTIALELLEDMHDVDIVLVPYGGGGLACGIASYLRAVSPHTTIFGVEVETAAPLSVALSNGSATPVSYTRTFVDGIGSGGVTDEMWPLVSALLDGSIVVSVADVANAVRALAERGHIVAEGAGAASLAAARLLHSRGELEGKRVACIVSGGNIDAHRLATILQGNVPE